MDEFVRTCPIPISEYPHVLMAHGGGGRLMARLLDRMFLSAFGSPEPSRRHDSATFQASGRMAFTTDSYVIHPIFFPGGDIGSLAVHGTVNDLAMAGARAAYLSAGFILEEGLPMETLWRVVCSMRGAAQACGVRIVTGDTKVVERGKADGLYVNTAGVGTIDHDLSILPASVRPGDALILSGDLGRHGMAVMAVREGLEFQSAIESDSAPVHEPVLALIEAGVDVHCLRDVTRGGLASVLNEIASAAQVGVSVDEATVPVRDDVRAACEILGLDPLYVACEGRFAAFVPADQAEKALQAMRRHPVSAGAQRIGGVTADHPGAVHLRTLIGVERVLDLLSGEQLPRIC